MVRGVLAPSLYVASHSAGRHSCCTACRLRLQPVLGRPCNVAGLWGIALQRAGWCDCGFVELWFVQTQLNVCHFSELQRS